MRSDWSSTILPDYEYYKTVLLDGCVVKVMDVEMCDLRFHMDQYSLDHKPMLQVYKANLNGEEYCEIFHNFEDAHKQFRELIKKGFRR